MVHLKMAQINKEQHVTNELNSCKKCVGQRAQSAGDTSLCNCYTQNLLLVLLNWNFLKRALMYYVCGLTLAGGNQNLVWACVFDPVTLFKHEILTPYSRSIVHSPQNCCAYFWGKGVGNNTVMCLVQSNLLRRNCSPQRRVHWPDYFTGDEGLHRQEPPTLLSLQENLLCVR